MLTTVDLVCHGVPPAKYLREHLEHVTADGVSEFTEVSFRDDSGFRLAVTDTSGLRYSQRWVRDSYYYGFMKSLTYRESCYHCRYASVRRCSDITLGDFWGLDSGTLDAKPRQRVSLVLVNTEQGRRLLDRIGDAVYSELRTVEEAVQGNPQLRQAAVPHRLRERFRRAYPAHGFHRAIEVSGVGTEIRVAALKCSRTYQLLRGLGRRLLLSSRTIVGIR